MYEQNKDWNSYENNSKENISEFQQTNQYINIIANHHLAADVAGGDGELVRDRTCSSHHFLMSQSHESGVWRTLSNSVSLDTLTRISPLDVVTRIAYRLGHYMILTNLLWLWLLEITTLPFVV
jgi:hypothetical protein